LLNVVKSFDPKLVGGRASRVIADIEEVLGWARNKRSVAARDFRSATAMSFDGYEKALNVVGTGRRNVKLDVRKVWGASWLDSLRTRLKPCDMELVQRWMDTVVCADERREGSSRKRKLEEACA
jgi:hypothetical protein